MPSSDEAPRQELSKLSKANNADPQVLLRLYLALGSRFIVKGHGSIQSQDAQACQQSWLMSVCNGQGQEREQQKGSTPAYLLCQDGCRLQCLLVDGGCKRFRWFCRLV